MDNNERTVRAQKEIDKVKEFINSHPKEQIPGEVLKNLIIASKDMGEEQKDEMKSMLVTHVDAMESRGKISDHAASFLREEIETIDTLNNEDLLDICAHVREKGLKSLITTRPHVILKSRQKKREKGLEKEDRDAVDVILDMLQKLSDADWMEAISFIEIWLSENPDDYAQLLTLTDVKEILPFVEEMIENINNAAKAAWLELNFGELPKDKRKTNQLEYQNYSKNKVNKTTVLRVPFKKVPAKDNKNVGYKFSPAKGGQTDITMMIGETIHARDVTIEQASVHEGSQFTRHWLDNTIRNAGLYSKTVDKDGNEVVRKNHAYKEGDVIVNVNMAGVSVETITFYINSQGNIRPKRLVQNGMQPVRRVLEERTGGLIKEIPENRKFEDKFAMNVEEMQILKNICYERNKLDFNYSLVAPIGKFNALQEAISVLSILERNSSGFATREASGWLFREEIDIHHLNGNSNVDVEACFQNLGTFIEHYLKTGELDEITLGDKDVVISGVNGASRIDLMHATRYSISSRLDKLITLEDGEVVAIDDQAIEAMGLNMTTKELNRELTDMAVDMGALKATSSLHAVTPSADSAAMSVSIIDDFKIKNGQKEAQKSKKEAQESKKEAQESKKEAQESKKEAQESKKEAQEAKEKLAVMSARLIEGGLQKIEDLSEDGVVSIAAHRSAFSMLSKDKQEEVKRKAGSFSMNNNSNKI